MPTKYVNVEQWLSIFKRDLEAMHTKQLLNLFENVRIKYMTERDYKEYGPEDSDNPYRPLYRLLKEILADREHIPRKPEAQAIRKQKQLAKQNR